MNLKSSWITFSILMITVLTSGNLLGQPSSLDRDDRIFITSLDEWLAKSPDSIIYLEKNTATDDWNMTEFKRSTYDPQGHEVNQLFLTRSENQWVNSRKLTATYNDKGNMVIDDESDWNTVTQEWFQVAKNEFSYDDDDNLILTKESSRDQSTGEWELDYQGEAVYDDEGEEISLASYITSSSGKLVGFNRTDYVHDENDLSTGILNYEWDSGIEDWRLDNKRTLTYNDAGQTVSYFSMKWDRTNEEWKTPHYKTEYTQYDEGREEVSYNWRNGAWVPSRKDHAYRDGQDGVTLYSRWSTSENEWKLHTRFDQTYDEQRREIDFVRSETKSGQELVNVIRHTTAYSNNSVTEVFFNWNASTEEWEPYHKDIEVYTTEGLLADRQELNLNSSGEWIGRARVTYTPEQNGHLVRRTMYGWSDAAQDWTPYWEDRMYFGEVSISPVLNVETVSQSLDCQIYPNPFVDQIRVSALQGKGLLTLYTEQGQQVWQSTVQSEQVLPITELPTGKYVYHLIAGQEHKRGLLIKK